MPNYEGRGGHSPGPSKADPMKMKLPKGPAPGASVPKTPELHLAGIVDPARYSDKAVAVIEVELALYDALTPQDIDSVKADVERELGMRCLILVGARLARIEEPTP